MLRIHFSDADLVRTRFAASAEPMWETMLGVYALGRGRVAAPIRNWRTQVRPRLNPGMRPLLSLFSSDGLFPDFLTPPVSGLSAGLAALDETPAEEIQAQLLPFLPAQCRNTGFHQDLLAGDARARRELRSAVTLVHQNLIAPLSGAIERRMEADLAVRSHTVFDRGITAALASLHRNLTWRSPTLFSTKPCPDGPVTDIVLGGRGLILYPTAFTQYSLIVDQPDRTPVLFYPSLDTEYDDRPDPAALADLLGRTRAEVLAAVGSGASTTELARRTGISPASASEHAAVLRRSGLVETRRAGQSAVHTLTELALKLLHTAGHDLEALNDPAVIGNATA